MLAHMNPLNIGLYVLLLVVTIAVPPLVLITAPAAWVMWKSTREAVARAQYPRRRG